VQHHAHDAESLHRIGVKVKVPARRRCVDGGEIRRQPVVAGNEPRHEIAADHEDLAVAFGQFDDGLDIPDEPLQGWRDRISHCCLGTLCVIARLDHLDPAIQLFAKRRDPRVKPAGDIVIG